VAIGASVLGINDPTLDPNEVPIGAKTLMLVLAIGLLVGFVAYALVEWLQTRRIDSIARQFDTRTIVLIPIAIAINIVLGQTVAAALKVPIYLDSIGTILVGVLAGPIAGAATGLLSNITWTFILAGTPFGAPFAWPFAIVAAVIGLIAGLFGRAGVFRSRPNTPPGELAAGISVALLLLAALGWFGILPFYRDLCGSGAGGAAAAGFCFQLFGPTGDVPPLFVALGYVVAALVLIVLVLVVVRLFRTRDLGIPFVVVAGATCGVISALVAAPIAAQLGGVTGGGTDFVVALFLQAGSDLQTAVVQQALISDSVDKTISFLIVFVVLGALSRRVTARFPQGEQALGTVEA
jgi:hypothetical protein